MHICVAPYRCLKPCCCAVLQTPKLLAIKFIFDHCTPLAVSSLLLWKHSYSSSSVRTDNTELTYCMAPHVFIHCEKELLDRITKHQDVCTVILLLPFRKVRSLFSSRIGCFPSCPERQWNFKILFFNLSLLRRVFIYL